MHHESSAEQATRRSLVGAARGGGLNIAAAVCSQVALFATTAVVARGLGERALGHYALGYAVLSILGLLALVGFQTAMTRFVAIHLADADVGRLRGALRLGTLVSVGLSVSLAAAVALLATPLANLFHSPQMVVEFRLVALSLPAATLRDVTLAAVQGWHTQRAYALISLVFEPIARLLLTVGAVAMGYGLIGAFAAITVGSWIAALLAGRTLLQRVRRLPHSTAIYEPRALLGFSALSWGTVLAGVGLIWADTLILGAMSTADAVGVYNVSTRLVNLAVFVMVPVNAAFGPQFAHLLHLRDYESLRQAYATATTWIIRLSLPAFILLTVFPSDLLRVFGPTFVVGATVTVILAIGQMVNAATGPCGGLLNMSGKVGLNLVNNLAVLVLNVALNVYLIPRHGILGAAFAWSVSLAAVNIARLIEVRVLFGGYPYGWADLKAIAAAAAAAVSALVAHAMLPAVLPRLVVGAALTAVIYLGTLVLLGFDAVDRDVIAGFTGHRPRPREGTTSGA